MSLEPKSSTIYSVCCRLTSSLTFWYALSQSLNPMCNQSSPAVYFCRIKLQHVCQINFIFAIKIINLQRQFNQVANIFAKMADTRSLTKHLLLCPATKGNLVYAFQMGLHSPLRWSRNIRLVRACSIWDRIILDSLLYVFLTFC